MNDCILKDKDDDKSFNIWSKGNYYKILSPNNLADKDEDVLIVTPKVDNSKNSISFEEFKFHILDNLDNSMIYAIIGTKSLMQDGIKRLFITTYEIINQEEYDKVMTIPRRVLLSKLILDDEEEFTIEISSHPSKSYSDSMRAYDNW